MKKYVFESLKFFCAAILCTILSAFATPALADLDPCRNLFDMNWLLKASGWTESNGVYSGKCADLSRIARGVSQINFEENTQYTISYNITEPAVTYARFEIRYTDGTSSQTKQFAGDGTSVTTTDAGKTVDYITFTYGSGQTISLSDFQIEKGTTATEYTPYNPQCATCNGTVVNYVSATGTGVQSGTPTPTNPIEPTFYKQGNMILRKVGDVADSYDATTGKITRRVGVKVLDGSEASWYEPNTNQRSISKAYLGMVPSGTTSVFVTHYPSGDAQTQNSVYVGSQYVNFIVGSQYTMEQWKQYLAQQYANGTPVTVYYPLETETTEDWPASYCETPIKIATTKYNETAFSPLNAALANAISVVDTVVSNTITQAASIATLQAQKQTRPADDTCPAYKQCLLVEDENGTPHWYEITDPFRDFVAPIIANNVAPASTTNSAGYTQLEYIESTGTQYIDTGVTSNDVSRITVNTRWRMNNFSGNTYVFGSLDRNASVIKDSAFGNLISYVDGKYYSNNYSFTASITQIPRQEVSFGTDYEYELKYENQRSSVKINDTTMSFSNDNATKSIPLSIYICKGNDTSLTDGFDGRVYYLKIELNGTLVRNMIPAKRNSDGAIGMYDTVTKTFFANAGTGTFTAGPIVENDADVPGMSWTATWAADATTGVAAGTVYGEGLCNEVPTTQGAVATLTQINASAWTENGSKCWCKVTGVDSGNEISTTDNVWVHVETYSSVANCETNCAIRCAREVRDSVSIRRTIFGE